MNKALALVCVSSTALLSCLPAAVAQEAPAATQETSGSPQEATPTHSDVVVVTGSRIARTGFATPTPVTATTNEELTLASPTMVADALNELPVFRGSTKPQNPGTSVAGSAGANILNLRNLGGNRLLVLLDGNRVIPSGLNGGVDVSLLPNLLLDRVDVVTGGASAAYGSDAVAGVVNYVLDTNYEGLKGGVQWGQSTYHDSDSAKYELAFGTSFADGRAHIIGSAEYYSIDGLGPYEGQGRDWLRKNPGVIPGPAGGPTRLVIPENVTLSGLHPAGIIPSGPLKGTIFNPDGSPKTFNYGSNASALFMVGGDGVFQSTALTDEVERQAYFLHAGYDVTDNFRVYAEGGYGKTFTQIQSYYWLIHSSSNFTIFSDNAYLDPTVRARMATAGVTSFPLARMLTENPFVTGDNTSTTTRGAVGFEGSLGEIHFEGAYINQRSELEVIARNLPKIRNMYAAADAVIDPATNQIVCRSTLMGYDPGCVPLDLFGVGAPSAAALRYISGDHYRNAQVEEQDINLSASGPLFSLWASQPVAFAVGLEYRDMTGEQTADPLGSEIVSNVGMRGLPASFVDNPGGYVIANFKPLNGSYNVKEAFTEIDAPIVSGVAFADLLTLNAAVRVADYSTSGRVTSWKVGLNYKPIADLRLRATRSRDVRGPNFVEYFSPQQNSGTTDVFDRRLNRFVNSLGLISGNPKLKPEVADTTVVGLVYEPAFASGLSVSVDAWRINLEEAISSLSAQETVDACAAGSAESCSNIIDLGNFYRVLRPSLNLASIKTSGVDIEAAYRFDLLGGHMSLRALATHLDKYAQQAFSTAPVVDRTGEVGGASNPDWTFNFQATYKRGPFTGFIQQRYISSGTYDATFREGVDISNNSVDSVSYTDATIKWMFEREDHKNFELFLSVDNLFDAAPPLAPRPASSLMLTSNYALYDPVGRYYTVGLRFAF